MKKFTLLFAMTLASVSIFAKTLYLVPSLDWLTNDARFAVYMYGNGEDWANLTLVDKYTHTYTVNVDEKYPNVIFCRMDPATNENNWDNKWNQTGDLTIAADKDLYTVSGWGDGAWSVFTPATYYIAGSSNLMQNGSWSPNQHQFVNGTVTIQNSPIGLHGLKISNGSSWDDNLLYVTIDATNSSAGVTGGGNDNISFTTCAVGDVTIDFDCATGLVVVTATTECYYVAGDEALTGCNWNSACAASQLENGSVTLSDVAPGTHTFRITDGGWTTEHGYDQIDWTCSTASQAHVSRSENDNNIIFTIAKTQDVTVTFDEDNNSICLMAETGTLYYIAGTPDLVQDGSWSEKRYMFDNNSYTINDLAAGDHVFKITTGTWASAMGWSTLVENKEECGNLTLTNTADDNVKFTLTEATDVTINYDADNTRVCVSAANGGTGTSLDAVMAELDLNAPMFNVLGQQVNAEYKGIVIQNGQKFIR